VYGNSRINVNRKTIHISINKCQHILFVEPQRQLWRKVNNLFSKSVNSVYNMPAQLPDITAWLRALLTPLSVSPTCVMEERIRGRREVKGGGKGEEER
jgi:hypothetical protein